MFFFVFHIVKSRFSDESFFVVFWSGSKGSSGSGSSFGREQCSHMSGASADGDIKAIYSRTLEMASVLFIYFIFLGGGGVPHGFFMVTSLGIVSTGQSGSVEGKRSRGQEPNAEPGFARRFICIYYRPFSPKPGPEKKKKIWEGRVDGGGTRFSKAH